MLSFGVPSFHVNAAFFIRESASEGIGGLLVLFVNY
jgi:hypothetical protein